MNRFFLTVIVANTLLLAAGVIDPGLEHALEPLHIVFLAVFVVEIVWRWRHGERGGWITFDTVVIVLALLPIIGASLTALRIARAARLAHMLRHATHLRHISALRILDVFRQRRDTLTADSAPGRV